MSGGERGGGDDTVGGCASVRVLLYNWEHISALFQANRNDPVGRKMVDRQAVRYGGCLGVPEKTRNGI